MLSWLLIDSHIPAGVIIQNGRIHHIAESIPRLRIVRAGDEGIGLGETSKGGRIESRFVIHQAHAQVTLTCVREVSHARLYAGTGHIGPHLAEGENCSMPSI